MYRKKGKRLEKGKRVTKGSGICGRKAHKKGVEKSDKAFLESLYYTKERVDIATVQLPMEDDDSDDEGY